MRALKLRKETLAALDDDRLAEVGGGDTTGRSVPCWTEVLQCIEAPRSLVACTYQICLTVNC